VNQAGSGECDGRRGFLRAQSSSNSFNAVAYCGDKMLNWGDKSIAEYKFFSDTELKCPILDIIDSVEPLCGGEHDVTVVFASLQSKKSDEGVATTLELIDSCMAIDCVKLGKCVSQFRYGI
jgi:hypothetical protein